MNNTITSAKSDLDFTHNVVFENDIQKYGAERRFEQLVFDSDNLDVLGLLDHLVGGADLARVVHYNGTPNNVGKLADIIIIFKDLLLYSHDVFLQITGIFELGIFELLPQYSLE